MTEAPRSGSPAGGSHPVAHLRSYRVLDRGATVAAEFATPDGSTLELLIPALHLSATLRNLVEAGRGADQIRAQNGLPADVVQAISVDGDPVAALSADGAVLLTFPASQRFPVVVALNRGQADALAKALRWASTAPAVAPPRH